MPLAFPMTIVVPDQMEGVSSLMDAKGAVWNILSDALRAKGYSCYQADGVLGQQSLWIIDGKGM